MEQALQTGSAAPTSIPLNGLLSSTSCVSLHRSCLLLIFIKCRVHHNDFGINLPAISEWYKSGQPRSIPWTTLFNFNVHFSLWQLEIFFPTWSWITLSQTSHLTTKECQIQSASQKTSLWVSPHRALSM